MGFLLLYLVELRSVRLWPRSLWKRGKDMENIRRRILGAYLRMVQVDGQGYTEYALILAAIAIAAITALTTLGTNITSALNSVAGKV